MRLVWREFKGAVPALHPSLLGLSFAVDARHCLLDRGSVRSMRGTEVVEAAPIATPKSFYPYASTYFYWPGQVDVVLPQLAADPHGRFIWTGDGTPKISYNAIATPRAADGRPAAAYRLGIPAPATAPTLTITGTATDANEIPDSRSYVCTYVDVFGAEGPPSPPSATQDYRSGQTATLSALPAAPSGDYNIQTLRLYRQSTGASGGAAYLFLADVAIGTASYVDSIASALLGEPLPTVTYDMPPDGLEGILALPGGYFAGFAGNSLRFSEPAAPHAWPFDYELTTELDIMGLASFGGGAFLVATKGPPYVVQGTSPASSTLAKLEGVTEPCLSKRSVLTVAGLAIYAGPEGLVGVSPSGAKMLTDGVFTKEQWAALVPATMRCFRWREWVLVGHDAGSFVLNPTAPEAGVVHFDAVVNGGRTPVSEEQFYALIGSNLTRWDAPAAALLSYAWESGVTDGPQLVNMGAGRVLADSYPVTCKVYGDGALQATVSVADARPFRLPGGYRARRHAVRIEGTAEVREAVIATSVTEVLG